MLKGEGKREALLLLLRQRFGRLPAATVARLDKAGATELDVWFRRWLKASSLDEVLEAKVAVPPNKAFSRIVGRTNGGGRRLDGPGGDGIVLSPLRDARPAVMLPSCPTIPPNPPRYQPLHPVPRGTPPRDRGRS